MIKFILKNGTVIEVSDGGLEIKGIEGGVSEEEVKKAAQVLWMWRKQIGKEGRRRKGRGEKCIICGNSLPSKKSKYCSPPCYKEGTRKTMKKAAQRRRLGVHRSQRVPVQVTTPIT